MRRLMKRLIAAIVVLLLPMHAALAASGKQPAPPGSFAGAPPEFTKFSTHELSRGFLALAFGSDLLIGKRPKGIRRYDHPIVARIIPGGSIDRVAAMTRIIDEYANKVPDLKMRVVSDAPADIEVRMIDEKDFKSALQAAFGARVARTFVVRTDPQCMTSVKSNAAGEIVHSVTFVIVDKGDDVFLDCAYHELLHAFGLSSHDQHNPWTTLNQNRMVGYLTIYDRALLTILYDPHMRPGMTPSQVRRSLPQIVKDRGLISSGDR